MNASKEIVTEKRLVILFLLFALATASLLVKIFAFSNTSAHPLFQKILFYFGALGMLAVIVVLLIHYLSQFVEWFKADNQRIIFVVAILLGLGYSCVDSVKEQSWLVFLKDIFMSGLLVLGLSCIPKIFGRNKKSKRKR